MKRAIEWFDELSDDFSCKPSEIVDMVQSVRAEALDSVELHVRRVMSAQADNKGAQVLQFILNEIQDLRSIK